MRGKAQRVDRL